jgi:hypothetical protein
MINWTNDALDAAAAIVNGRGYARFSIKNKTKIREEMRAMLDAALAAQGCIELPETVVEKMEEYLTQSN